MANRFFPYFTTIFFLHVLLLMGTWQLSQTDYVQTQLKKLGNGVLKLQVASKIMMNEAPVQKKVERVVPLNPNKPKSPETVQNKKSENAVPETQQGQSNGSEFGSSSVGSTDILSVYKAELRAMIEKNKSYPAISKRLGQSGTVVVAFTLLKDGNIIDLRIDRASPYERLNSSALEAVKKVQRFKPIPKELGEEQMTVKVPVNFKTI